MDVKDLFVNLPPGVPTNTGPPYTAHKYLRETAAMTCDVLASSPSSTQPILLGHRRNSRLPGPHIPTNHDFEPFLLALTVIMSRFACLVNSHQGQEKYRARFKITAWLCDYPRLAISTLTHGTGSCFRAQLSRYICARSGIRNQLSLKINHNESVEIEPATEECTTKSVHNRWS